MSKKNTILSGIVVVFAGLLIFDVGRRFSDSALIAKQATELEQMRTADERMERSRTNYDRPGVTQEEVDMIEAVAKDYGMPPELLYAFRRQENGGRGLYLGAMSIDSDIRKRYPPLWWQFAQGAKVWNQHLNENVRTDPYLLRPTLRHFARRWYPDNPDAWVDGVLGYLQVARGNNLEVTEPPKKAKGGKSHKAKGGGHKPPRHEQELNR